MKVMHVLNSRIFTGAEKVVGQIITSFAGDDNMEMVYCSPKSQIVGDILAEQGIRYVTVNSLTPAQLGKVIREEKPDLIHAHDMRASFVSALCCGNIPLLSHIHNNAYDARGLSPKSVAYILAGLRAKRILWVSKSSFDGYFFHKLFEKKSSVLYNIIDVEQILRKKEQDTASYDFDVIYVGRLTYQKDPQRLMRIWRQLKDKKDDIRIAVVGTGELEEETQSLCAELGLKDNVQFLGFRPNPIKMVSDAKVMVLTSRWEGTPMCVLEAMALGTPVVSTPSDGMLDLIENGVHGYLCEEDRDLVEKLLLVVNEEAHRKELGENCLKKSAVINDAERYKQAISVCYR